MITLDTKPYCDACPNFEPVVISRPEKLYGGSLDGEDRSVMVGDTVVSCRRRKYCENIKRYLEQHERFMRENTEIMNAAKEAESNDAR